jgi:hypothetical protein
MGFVPKNRQFLLMAVGCVTMVVAVFILTTKTSGGSWSFYLLLLLCPVMHFLMHRVLHDSGNRNEMPHAQLPTPVKEPSVEKQSRPSE